MPWAGIQAPSLLEKQEVRRGQLEGLGRREGSCPLSGLAEPPTPICRGAARPPRVGWETSELRSACSPNILFTADGSHNSLFPCSSGCTSLPCAHPPVNFAFCLWRWRGSLQPPKPPLTVVKPGAQSVDSVQGRGNLEPPICFVREAVLPRFPHSILSLFGETGQQRDLRRTRAWAWFDFS